MNYIAAFILTIIFVLINFALKYFSGLFYDYFNVDQLVDRVVLGDITVTQGFIVTIVVGVVIGLVYDLLGIKNVIDPIFEDSMFKDND